MADGVRFEIQGLAKLERQLGKFSEDTRRQAEGRLGEFAGRVATTARSKGAFSRAVQAFLRAETIGGEPAIRLRRAAPPAAHPIPWELGTKGRKTVIRHPVFARRGSARYENPRLWVEHRTRKFIQPAIRLEWKRLFQFMNRAVEETWAKLS